MLVGKVCLGIDEIPKILVNMSSESTHIQLQCVSKTACLHTFLELYIAIAARGYWQQGHVCLCVYD